MTRIDLSPDQMTEAVWEYLRKREMIPNVPTRLVLMTESSVARKEMRTWVEVHEVPADTKPGFRGTECSVRVK